MIKRIPYNTKNPTFAHFDSMALNLRTKYGWTCMISYYSRAYAHHDLYEALSTDFSISLQDVPGGKSIYSQSYLTWPQLFETYNLLMKKGIDGWTHD